MTTRIKLSLIAAALIVTGTSMTAASANIGGKQAGITIKTTGQATEASVVPASPEPSVQPSISVAPTAPAVKVVSQSPLTVEADPSVPDPTPEATPEATPVPTAPPAPACDHSAKPGICVSN